MKTFLIILSVLLALACAAANTESVRGGTSSLAMDENDLSRHLGRKYKKTKKGKKSNKDGGKVMKKNKNNKKRMHNDYDDDDDDDDDDDEVEDYVQFVSNSVDVIFDNIRAIVEANTTLQESGLMADIEFLLTEGETKFEASLPFYFYTNYRAIIPAYTIGTTRQFIVPELFALMVQGLKYHRVLGHGNALRIQGWPEEVVQAAYWNHHELLTREDATVPPTGDGLSTYCSYTTAEYEQFKQFVRDNYNATDLPNPATFTNPAFFTIFCSDPVLGYISRSDWEHHRRELVSSLMSGGCTRPIVLYTVWHWESLFQGLILPRATAYATFIESFEYIKDTFATPDSMC